MHDGYLQNVRYKLQRRVRRLNAANSDQFLYALKRFWVFFDNSPILRGLTEHLEAEFPKCQDTVEKILKSDRVVGETEEESAVIGYSVLRRFASQDFPDAFWTYGGTRGEADIGQALDYFKREYLDPLCDYLDENLDDRNYILSVLARYRHVCEWFERDRLYRLWEVGTQAGEKLLSLDLYRYLYEHGIDFQIEPWSISGEADMVSSQSSENPLIAEAKIFNPDRGKGKPYLIQAFQQTYLYACDHNQPVGYIVIFNTSDTQLRFALSASGEPVPHVVLNNKVIFFSEVDIFPHAESASRRKPLKAVEVTEEEIVEGVHRPHG